MSAPVTISDFAAELRARTRQARDTAILRLYQSPEQPTVDEIAARLGVGRHLVNQVVRSASVAKRKTPLPADITPAQRRLYTKLYQNGVPKPEALVEALRP